MKIALCLKGIIGGNNKSQKYGLGPRDINIARESFNFWKINFIEINKPDIFIHCWDVEYKEEIINMYSPKKFIFEEQIDFGKNKDVKKHAIRSNYYSSKKSIDIMRKYEEENNFKYDVVVLSRFDLALLKPLTFDNLNLTDYFYHNGENPIHKYPQINPIICDIHNKKCCDKNSIKYEIGDLLFFSSSNNMYSFSKLYEEIENYIYLDSSHRIAYQYVKKLNLNIDSKLTTKVYNIHRGTQDGDITLTRWMT